MSLLVDALALLAILLGLVFFAAGTAGLLRFPDASSRLHALTKADHLGLGLIVIGLLPRAEAVGGPARLIAVWVLVLVSSAAAGPLLARLARRR
ncbi:cation:proton antiporter [Roseomonas rosulenta]|uniref:cation:proton antiporter n=1 Tax=Roseomonas rosulenta TaxID=2748667 RepID=UPI0018DFEED9|nr:monovalent cation/H(+) antiporter subunit G [Roseomonas rosulenta]